MLNNVESLKYFLPEMILAAVTIVILLADLVVKKGKKAPLSIIMLLGLGLAFVFTLKMPYSEGMSLFFGMVTLDAFSIFFKLIFIATAALVVIFSLESREVEETNFGEYLAFIAATTLILGAAYTLWMVKRVIFGDIANEQVAELSDINRREYLVLGALAIAVIVMGVWPAPLLEVMGPTIDNLVIQLMQSKL